MVNQCGKSDVELFGGRVREFLWVEVFVFTFFMLTMLILMVKSRFMPVGVDNSGQFGEDYMSFLAEKIVRQIDINKQNAKKSEEFFVDMERIVQVKGVALKVCLPQDEFEKLLKSKDVPKSEATQWI